MKIVDEQIDRLVYDLYGLTVEEIEVIEGKQSLVSAYVTS